LCLLSAGIVLGYLASFAVAPTAIVRAEVTEEPRREAFKAGAVLNEPVLREIAATLKRIETHMERIDKHTTPTAPPAAAPRK
jgi:hypothetical protein